MSRVTNVVVHVDCLPDMADEDPLALTETSPPSYRDQYLTHLTTDDVGRGPKRMESEIFAGGFNQVATVTIMDEDGDQAVIVINRYGSRSTMTLQYSDNPHISVPKEP